MNNIYENLIECEGISKYIPKNLRSYKELDIDSIIKLKIKKHKIKEIIKISTISNILSTRIVKTPRCVSLEGQKLTGAKYIIEAQLQVRVDYLSKEDENKIYFLYHNKDFSSSIILEEDLIGKYNIIPSLFIEGINGELLSDDEVLVINKVLTVVER